MVIIFKLRKVAALFKSLRFRLFAYFLTFGVLPVLVYRGVLVEGLRVSQLQGRVMEIQTQGRILCNQLVSNKYLEDTAQTTLNSSIDYLSSIYDGRIMVIDKSFRIVKDTYVLDEGKLNISEDVLIAFNGNTNDRNQINDGYVEFIFPIYNEVDAEKSVEGVMVLIASTERMADFISQVLNRSHLLELVALILLLVISFFVSKALTTPFRTLVQNLNHAADDILYEEIGVETFTEAQEISDSVTTALVRLRNLDESRQEFVSNVSHELKTPITSIRVLADSLMAQEDAPIELYREFMADISEEIDRESKIIDDLLTLVRLDKTATELTVTPVIINEMLKLILKRLRPLANMRNIELVLESFRPVTAEVDEVKLTLALSNLVENAIKYNIVNGWVRITLDADHKFCYVKVADSGIGIPEEFQSNIFERFYRVDKARSREKGGTGLGLSITKSIILLHHGAIKVSSKENEGTTFTVRIPLTYIV